MISKHLLKSPRFGRDSRFMLNKIFGALAANVGSGSVDSGLSSIAICSLHGCYGSSLHVVVLLLIGFGGGAVSVCVGRGENDRSGIRRGNRVLPPATDSASTAAMFNTTGGMCDSPDGQDSHIHLGTGRTRGLLMVSPELEEFASGVFGDGNSCG